MLNLERSTAELMQILVLSSGRKRVLEIGTSNGYSALWLGSTLRRIPQAQRLLTIEHDAHKVQQARMNIARCRSQRDDHGPRGFGHGGRH